MFRALQSVPCFVFPGGGECFTHTWFWSVSGICICICLIIFLVFRDLKHKVMVGICHPVLFLLISAGDMYVNFPYKILGPPAVSGNPT